MIVGALGAPGRAFVGDRGQVAVHNEDWSLDWWIGADDRVRVPSSDPSTRRVEHGGAPIAQTRLRVPGGDAVQRVYGIGGSGGAVVVEVANESPAAFVVGFSVVGARSISPVSVDGASGIAVDGRLAILMPYAPPRWSVNDVVGAAPTIGESTGAMPACSGRSGVNATICFPLSHRNRLRIALLTSGSDPGRLDLVNMPDADEVARGWNAHLDKGMRVVLNDAREEGAINFARSQVLLDPDPDAGVAAALEDWGYDTEATIAWEALSLRARRASVLRRGLDAGDSASALLLRMRNELLRETHDGVDLLPSRDRRANVDVHGAPTRFGSVSFAIRRMEEKVKVLWEVTDPAQRFVLRASALDDSWNTSEAMGEAILSANRD